MTHEIPCEQRDLRTLVSEAQSLLTTISRLVTQRVHDLLPPGYSFLGAVLEQDGRYEVTYEVCFRRNLVLTVPQQGNGEPFRAQAVDLNALRPSLGVIGNGDDPREALLALIHADPTFAAWRGEATPKAAPGSE